MKKMALVAVGYNRVESISRLLDSLNKAYYGEDYIDLYISLDKWKTNEVIDFASSFVWEHGKKYVLTYPERLGLRAHILKCGNLLERYDAIAMLEDDVLVSENFYRYMKQSVEFYYDNPDIAGISLYANRWNEFAGFPFTPSHSEFDSYFFQFAESRGQIWLKNQWFEFMKWYEKNKLESVSSENLPKSLTQWPESSWKKYHVKYCVDTNKFFVYPYVSLATCFSDFGTHTKRIDTFIQVGLYHGHSNEYIFPEISSPNAVFYDVFYERMNMKGFSDCCFDLYGIKEFFEGKRYLYSSKNLPFKIVSTYGLQLKPHEENVLYGVGGNCLFKYDLTISDRINKHCKLSNFRYYYDLYDHSRELLSCIFDSATQRLKKYIKLK